jgi:hypothetical protein
VAKVREKLLERGSGVKVLMLELAPVYVDGACLTRGTLKAISSLCRDSQSFGYDVKEYPELKHSATLLREWGIPRLPTLADPPPPRGGFGRTDRQGGQCAPRFCRGPSGVGLDPAQHVKRTLTSYTRRSQALAEL